MKYDYIVKSGGVYYAAGEDVPQEKNANVETGSEPDRSEIDMEELPFSDTDIQLESEPTRRGRPRKSDM